MPVYEYACTECGERLEVRQSFTDDPLSVCPACSGKLRKVLSPVGVVFKGSGFYRTDSRAAAGSANGSSGGSSGGSGDGTKGSGKDSSKPADKNGSGTSSSGSADKAKSGSGSSGTSAA